LHFLRRCVARGIYITYEFMTSEVAVYPNTPLAMDLFNARLVPTLSMLGPIRYVYEDPAIGKLAGLVRQCQPLFDPIDQQMFVARNDGQISDTDAAKVSSRYLDLLERALEQYRSLTRETFRHLAYRCLAALQRDGVLRDRR
ncbi:unnamed protein product, partial [marine sediment metagenome]